MHEIHRKIDRYREREREREREILQIAFRCDYCSCYGLIEVYIVSTYVCEWVHTALGAGLATWVRGVGGWHLLDYASPSVGGRWPVAVVAPVRCSGGRAPAKRPVPERTMDRIRSFVMDQCAQCEGGRAMVTFVKHIDIH